MNNPIKGQPSGSLPGGTFKAFQFARSDLRNDLFNFMHKTHFNFTQIDKSPNKMP